MNDALFCSIHVDSAVSRDEMLSLVSALTGGVIVRRGVDCPWARIAVNADYGDIEARKADPDDFLGWPTQLEIMPPDDAERSEVVRGVTSLMNALLGHGVRVLGQCEYAEELPGRGEVASPATVSR